MTISEKMSRQIINCRKFIDATSSPIFDSDEPEMFFTDMNTAFRLHEITDDTLMFEITLFYVPPKVRKMARLLLNSDTDGKMAKLKIIVMECYDMSIYMRITKLLAKENRGVKSRSEFLRCLWEIDEDDKYLRKIRGDKTDNCWIEHHFYESLPNVLRTMRLKTLCRMLSEWNMSIDEIARIADMILEFKELNPDSIEDDMLKLVFSLYNKSDDETPKRLDDLEKQISDLTLHNILSNVDQKRDAERPQRGHGAIRRDCFGKSVCYATSHSRYGNRYRASALYVSDVGNKRNNS